MKKKDQACAYCGLIPAGTVDHIPPQSLFPKPRPNDLITVPACEKCNHGDSRDDEEFKAFVGLHLERLGANNAQLASNAVKTLEHNKRLLRESLSSAKPGWIKSLSGVLIEKAVYIDWPSESHDRVIGRITRGLFWHHAGRKVPESATVKAYFFKELPSSLQSNELPWEYFSIANGAFSYGLACQSNFEVSIWLFEFYEKHWAGAFVTNGNG